MNSSRMRIVNKEKNLYKIGFYISRKREIFVTCSDLEVGNYDYDDLVKKWGR